MAYAVTNFKTKKALKTAVTDGEEVRIFQPNGDLYGSSGDLSKFTGTICLEGPHYPEPHRWYAEVTVSDGRVTKVK